MRVTKAVMVLTLTIAGIASIPRGVWAQQMSDPILGTWEMDTSKSKFSPSPGPKSITVRFEQAAGGIKATSDAVMPDGKRTHTEFTANYDGKDVPLTGSPIADTVSVTKTGDTRVRTDKKDGKVVMTYTGTVSKDGKTFTVQQKGTNQENAPVNNVVVFRKQ
jgi:hypothetical protein